MEIVILTAVGVGLATVIGAIIGFLIGNISHKFSDIFLGFAAGIMLAAAMMGLIIPSIDLGNVFITILGVIVGAVVLNLIDICTPHQHLDNSKLESNEENTKRLYITPVLESRWDKDKILMEYQFSDGRISIDEYNTAHRGKEKKADYLLLHKDYIPLAVVEAKGMDHNAGEGQQQALEYSTILDTPFAYATNGQELLEFDKITGLNRTMTMADFPSAEALWERYLRETAMSTEVEDLYTTPYYITTSGKRPRYYQRIAINRAIKAIAEGQKRLMLVLATGTGKTFTSFQIIYRYWKTRKFKKILYLADRNILIDQTMRKDFKPFMEAMEKIDNRKINTSKEIFLGLYQQLKTGETDYYKQLPRDFFDLIIIDECHRGSASQDSNWHDILTYFSSAVQLGMTATPKDGGIQEAYKAEQDAREAYERAQGTGDIEIINKAKRTYEHAIAKRGKAETECNAAYFGNPLYTYSLKQGIEDGFLAPYKVINVELNIDKLGWTPPVGTKDTTGKEVERRVYTQDDFDRTIVSPDRRKKVAERISEFMKTNDMRYAKTIVFCEDIAHCEEMVRLLQNENADLVKEDPRYIMQITGDNEIGKTYLDSFIDPSSKYPVIAVTSKLLSTGVDAETCEIIVLDRSIGSMTEFKQIIGRGTRIKPQYECDGEQQSKMYFTILDFRTNYTKFNDPKFDGDPVTVTIVDDDHTFPKPPVKPGYPPTPTPPAPVISTHKKKIARINGIYVDIIDENVFYYDENGNLVKQDLISCTRNNIVTQYSTLEDFRAAWLLANDKARMASELLLDVDWSENFAIQYGYAVDAFDVIAKIGYDVEPPMSKSRRAKSIAVMDYLSTKSDEQAEILAMLLDTYIASSFENLKAIKEIFSMPKFTEIGLTPQRAVKMFGGKERYFEVLKALENKLYE